MEVIQKSIAAGIDKLNLSKEKYLNTIAGCKEEIDAMAIVNDLSPEADVKLGFLNKQFKNISSFVNYVDFIIDELKKITSFVNHNQISDLNHECIYFGIGTLYYSDKFLDYSEEEMFDVILNHIIHYTGGLYMIHSNKARLSYILAMVNACYGHIMNYKEGIKLYDNNIAKCNHLIFDVKDSYAGFIAVNKNAMPFIQEYEDIMCVYRLSIGNEIIFELNNVIINNNNKLQLTNSPNKFMGLFDNVFTQNNS